MSAKSRLKPKLKETLIKNQSNTDLSSSRNRKKLSQSHKNTQLNKLRRYIKHLPLFIISIPFYFVIYYILLNVYPKNIANIPIYNSYLGLLIPFFLANKFLFSYLFLNSKRGNSLSFILTILLFLKLQHFIFEYWWFAPIVIFFVIDEKLSKKIKWPKRKRG